LWETASKSEAQKLEYETLRAVIECIREAGDEVIEGTDFPSSEEIIPPTGWDW
jgi:amidase